MCTICGVLIVALLGQDIIERGRCVDIFENRFDATVLNPLHLRFVEIALRIHDAVTLCENSEGLPFVKPLYERQGLTPILSFLRWSKLIQPWAGNPVFAGFRNELDATRHILVADLDRESACCAIHLGT